MKMIHFLATPFTGLGLYQGFRGNHWLANRIKIFKHFVLPSLLAQTNHEFVHWIAWRPEEAANPLVQELERELNQLRDYRFIFTYGGCFFYDDKYDPVIAAGRLLGSLETNLSQLEKTVGDAEVVYMTIQPSDDCYLSHAVSDIQSHKFKARQSLGYKQGYIMNYQTLEIAEYNPETIPPFFTIMFPREDFLDPQKHYDYTGPYVSHEYIAKHTSFAALPGRGFIVGTHGENVSTHFNHPFKGRLLTLEEQEKVLIQAGLFGVEPLIVSKNKERLRLQNTLGLLPLPVRRRLVTFFSPGVNQAIKSYKFFRI